MIKKCREFQCGLMGDKYGISRGYMYIYYIWNTSTKAKVKGAPLEYTRDQSQNYI